MRVTTLTFLTGAMLPVFHILRKILLSEMERWEKEEGVVDCATDDRQRGSTKAKVMKLPVARLPIGKDSDVRVAIVLPTIHAEAILTRLARVFSLTCSSYENEPPIEPDSVVPCSELSTLTDSQGDIEEVCEAVLGVGERLSESEEDSDKIGASMQNSPPNTMTAPFETTHLSNATDADSSHSPVPPPFVPFDPPTPHIASPLPAPPPPPSSVNYSLMSKCFCNEMLDKFKDIHVPSQTENALIRARDHIKAKLLLPTTKELRECYFSGLEKAIEMLVLPIRIGLGVEAMGVLQRMGSLWERASDVQN